MRETIKEQYKVAEAKTMKMKRKSIMFLCFAVSAVLAIFVFSLFVNVTYAADGDDFKRARMSIAPSSGEAPLSVVATIYAESQLLCTSFSVDWGDGSAAQSYDPGVYDTDCYGGKFVREFAHTYAVPGLYNVQAKAGPDTLDELNTMLLSVTAHEEGWAGDLEEGSDDSSCFINPNYGNAPFATAAYVSLGGALCDGSYEYYIDWGDGYSSPSRFCNNTVNHYDILYHEYATSSDYTATLVRNHGVDTIADETCSVSVIDAPQITITKPDWGGTAIIGEPFGLEWSIKNAPEKKNGIEPTVRLTFVTQGGQAGFITDVGIGTTSYNWVPTTEPCLLGACQSSIEEGKYYIQASIIYDICDGDPYCGEPIPVAASDTSTAMITVSNTGVSVDSWLYTVRDRMFAYPTVASAPTIVHFTTVLNSEALCAGGVYVIQYGDGESSSLAFPQGKCAAFASSFTHSYGTAGVYPVVLYKNGFESARMSITITNPLTAKSNTQHLASAWEAFTDLLTHWFSF